jgi:hypothetical protein
LKIAHASAERQPPVAASAAATRPAPAVFVPPRKAADAADARKTAASAANGSNSRNGGARAGQVDSDDSGWLNDVDLALMWPLSVGTYAQQEQQDQQQDQQERQAMSDKLERLAAVSASQAADTETDTQVLADLLAPSCQDNGIFELLLPQGNSLRVAVKKESDSTQLMLWPTPPPFGKKLIDKKMELQDGLQRRMKGHLTLTLFE